MKNQNHKKGNYSRRKFIGSAAAITGATLLSNPILGNTFRLDTASPFGKFKGVNLGVITYSFRSMPGTADDLLGYLAQLGLGSVELMSDPIEAFAGAPKAPPRKRGKLTEEEQAVRKAYTEELRKWRLSTSMKPYKKLRKKFKAEGINIEVAKFRLDRMTNEEIDYCFRAAKALGAKGITLERSDEAVRKLGPFADKHKRLIGYHNHAKVDFHSWDEAVAIAKYNAINLDVGHYVAGTNESPIPLIKKYHDRILNLHLKDRKFDNGDNMPWGEGDTPLREILQLIHQCLRRRGLTRLQQSAHRSIRPAGQAYHPRATGL